MIQDKERLNEALVDRYRIDREIGTGGMATVYLAQDLKHDRKVAVKVLKPELAAVLGGERFLVEIRTTASLQHPHILPLFDSGEAKGFLFYVMPYVEGESLRARLDRERHLGVDEAITITCAVASALDYAHRHGVIHRDIKPGNILIHDGEPMVADFGIALAIHAAGGARLTETGLSLGTPHYMSPEQASGDREVDGRSDIYSLACVLYEILAGEPPHTAPTVQAVIARLLTEKPRPVTELRETVPGHVATALHRALEKLPADRFGSAAEFAAALKRRGVAAPPEFRPKPALEDTESRRLVVALIALVAIALGYLAGFLQWHRDVGVRPFDVGLPDTAQVAFTKGNPWGTGWPAFEISPEGDFAVYIADVENTTMLWKRNLVDFTADPIPGTEGAYQLFLSPDGGDVAFVSGDRLKMVSLDEPGVTTLLEVDRPYGAQWLAEGRLLIADSSGSQLSWIDTGNRAVSGIRVSAGGCLLPSEVPGSDLVLCSGTQSFNMTGVNVTDGTQRDLRVSSTMGGGAESNRIFGSAPRVIDDRYLLWVSIEGFLYAASFDPENLTLGTPMAVLRGFRREGLVGAGQFDVSRSGTLVYAPGGNMAAGRLVKGGGAAPADRLPSPAAAVVQFDITTDGGKLAVVEQEFEGQQLFVYDLDSGSKQRLLSAFSIREPRWSPNGDRLVFELMGSQGDEWVTATGFAFSPMKLDTIHEIQFTPSDYFAEDMVLGSISYGGEAATDIGTRGDLVVVDLTHDPVLVDTLGFAEGLPSRVAVSPDGAWIAYMFSGSGLEEIRLEPFQRTGPRYTISLNGGLDPLWLDENELVYRSGTTWWKVPVDENHSPPVGDPQEWFSDPSFIDTWLRSQVQTPDGEIIYLQSIGRNTASFLRVVPNWVEQMKDRVDAANR